MTVDEHLRDHAVAVAVKRDWERAAAFVWAAAGVVAVALVAATFAFGDLVERRHLRSWIRTEGRIVAASGGDVALTYSAAGTQRSTVLDPDVNPEHKVGERPETWFDPAHPDRFVIAADTPLHNLPVASGVGLTSLALAFVLLRRSGTLRASARRGARPAPSPASRPESGRSYPSRDWLFAAAVPLIVCLTALGWLVAHPEDEGSPQLSLALMSYVAALFGVSRWLRAERAEVFKGQGRSSAA
jgi:hypothetical protein